MPPTFVHLNGSINLPDAETAFREVGQRIGPLASRYSDGETGDRGNWIFFQLARYWATPGLEQAGMVEREGATGAYRTAPAVRVAEGTDPDTIEWPNLGYADAYIESYRTFRWLRDEGVIPAGTRFQVQYPTPLASINAWVLPEDQDRLEPSYTRALYADLARLLDAIPHDDVAVQWDVAVEFGILVGPFALSDTQNFDGIVRRLVEAVEQVPAEVPVVLHLCYGDYEHGHFKEPESLELQVRVANQVSADASRAVSWYSFTVPQYQADPAYFAPLAELTVGDETEISFALVPYHPEQQEAGVTERQVAEIDRQLGDRRWGVNTECGMGRCEREEVTSILDLHRHIVAGAAAPVS